MSIITETILGTIDVSGELLRNFLRRKAISRRQRISQVREKHQVERAKYQAQYEALAEFIAKKTVEEKMSARIVVHRENRSESYRLRLLGMLANNVPGEIIDQRALESDWCMVGDDIEYAMKKADGEHGIKELLHAG